MTAKTNDAAIIALQEKVAKKRESITKAKRFAPITNCSLDLGFFRSNINTCDIEQLKHLMVYLNMYKMSAKELKFTDPQLCGFAVNDWLTDLQARLDNLSRHKDMQVLKKMEAKLSKLLSEEKRTEMELCRMLSTLDNI